MLSRRLVFFTAILATAVSCFTPGLMQSRRGDAASRAPYDAKLDAIRDEMRSELRNPRETDAVVPAGTSGRLPVGATRTTRCLIPDAEPQ